MKVIARFTGPEFAALFARDLMIFDESFAFETVNGLITFKSSTDTVRLPHCEADGTVSAYWTLDGSTNPLPSYQIGNA